MTITRIIELSCDFDDCDVAYAPSFEELTSLKLTRVGSIFAGWTQKDGDDFCPAHPQQDERVERIRALVGQKLNDSQIGRRLGLPRHAVQKLRSANGIRSGLGRVGRPSG